MQKAYHFKYSGSVYSFNIFTVISSDMARATRIFLARTANVPRLCIKNIYITDVAREYYYYFYMAENPSPQHIIAVNYKTAWKILNANGAVDVEVANVT